MNQVFTAKNEDDLSDISKKIIDFSDSNLFLLYGDMGVGKTTLVKSLCSMLDVVDVVTSPTFSIVNQYKRSNNKYVFHFDFYRTKNENEIFDIGYEEYLFSSSYCFVEWPEKAEELLPNRFVKIEMKLENNFRKIRVKNINQKL
jgi:tRNA threonylcarbamoyladenosine biosynthesis protein TsaE